MEKIIPAIDLTKYSDVDLEVFKNNADILRECAINSIKQHYQTVENIIHEYAKKRGIVIETPEDAVKYSLIIKDITPIDRPLKHTTAIWCERQQIGEVSLNFDNSLNPAHQKQNEQNQ